MFLCVSCCLHVRLRVPTVDSSQHLGHICHGHLPRAGCALGFRRPLLILERRCQPFTVWPALDSMCLVLSESEVVQFVHDSHGVGGDAHQPPVHKGQRKARMMMSCAWMCRAVAAEGQQDTYSPLPLTRDLPMATPPLNREFQCDTLSSGPWATDLGTSDPPSEPPSWGWSVNKATVARQTFSPPACVGQKLRMQCC